MSFKEQGANSTLVVARIIFKNLIFFNLYFQEWSAEVPLGKLELTGIVNLKIIHSQMLDTISHTHLQCSVGRSIVD